MIKNQNTDRESEINFTMLALIGLFVGVIIGFLGWAVVLVIPTLLFGNLPMGLVRYFPIHYFFCVDDRLYW
jgi:uncharacterized membrane protein YfcA